MKITALLCPQCSGTLNGCGKLPDGRLFFMCPYCGTPSVEEIDKTDVGLANKLKDVKTSGTNVKTGPYVVFGEIYAKGTNLKLIVLRKAPDHAPHIRNLTVEGTNAVAEVYLAPSATYEIHGTNSKVKFKWLTPVQ